MSFIRLSVQKILYQLLILVLFYTIFRWLFYAFNSSEIRHITSGQLWNVLKGGLRFDLSAIMYLNALWILLTLLVPLDLQNKTGRRLISLSFWLPNTIAFLLEISDWVYFNFNRKRATIEIFDLIFSKGDFLNLLPNYLQKFWFVPLIAACCITLLIWSHMRLNRYFAERWRLFRQLQFRNTKHSRFVIRPLVLLLFAGLAVLLIRGGLQLQPIANRTAVLYVNPEQTPLVLNTPFSIISSLESGHLEAVHFMDAAQADQLIRPVKQYHSDPAWNKKNVIVIVWESFSKRYTKEGGSVGVTPFFDSLSAKGHLFTNAYANALRSNEGVPAIFSGYPAMMEGPVINSVYGNTAVDALPGLLQAVGYTTAFFHGGTNGTMGFDVYAKRAGFERYFGRKEYANEQDFDGTWGIWDQPFLDFALRQINTFKTPFLAGIFTLTSHVPFHVPKGFKPTAKGFDRDIEISMNYTDWALSQFFTQAAKQAWFSNTVFVITADHTNPYVDNPFQGEGLGRYQVPILIIDPANERLNQKDSTLVQQLDIIPSILDYIQYPKPFFALGNSAWDTTANRFFITYLSGNYNMIRNGYHIKTKGFEVSERYKFPEDITDRHNLHTPGAKDPEVADTERYFKAFLQILHTGMINDELSLHTYPLKRGTQ